MGDAGKLEPLFLLSDEPIRVSGDDGLGMNQTARVIAEAALGAATPFTVGIFGTWGHGKTSLLNAARTLLEPMAADGTITRPHPHVVTVQFNAWRYEKEEHPIVPLVASIARAVKQRLEEDRTFGNAVGEKGTTIAKTFYDGAISLISAVKVDAKGEAGVPFVAKGEVSASIDGETFLSRWKDRLLNRKQSAEPRVQSWIDKSLYLSAFDDLARLHAAAKASGANKTGQAPVIVVFIDDLDRCRPEAAVEILEGIKLVLAQPGFVFVLALYREVIERYLEQQSEVRYGKERKDIGAGYIDKIVQLPLWLPSHEESFQKYIRTVIKTKLKPGLLASNADRSDATVKGTRALLSAVYRCTPLLSRLSNHSPRKLVRKINELLIDDRLLPLDAHTNIGCTPERRRAILFPLLLIQRALQELSFPKQMDALIANNDLCTALAAYRPELADITDADGNVAPMLFRDALKARTQESGARDGKPDASAPRPVPVPGDPVLSNLDATTAARWLKATDCLSQDEYRAVLLNTTAGRVWLANHAGRRVVTKAIVTQAVPMAGPVSKAVDPNEGRSAAEKRAGGGTHGADPVSEALRQEIAIIERTARLNLNLRADAPISVAEWGRVTELNLTGDPITDAGAAWLADAATGLRALTKLDLSSTQITDAGVAALAAQGSCLRKLTTLGLNNTQITDAGAAELAVKDSGVRGLTTLSLYNTQLTDAGAKALASQDSGLRALTTLELGGTQITDAGAAALAAQDSGLQALTTLSLGGTEISDAGAKALAATNSGLRSLTMLDLSGTQITNAGAAALAAHDSGLRALNVLELSATQITDAGAAALAAKNSGLRALTDLDISGTEITDKGAAALAAPDSGLRALTTLSLYNTELTDAGAKALAAQDSGLRALTSLFLGYTGITDAGAVALATPDSVLRELIDLNLSGTKITDAGAKALVAQDSGLRSLDALYVSRTKITDAGVAAIKASRPRIKVFR
ncbi:MAG: hypothetical protein K2X32_02405 [Phycisphaerales bacterium]|nr:hypothetical protein [Phycisphaerales bacterium]